MPLAVFTTIDTAAAGDRLAACVQIEKIRSVCRWAGVVRDEPEFRLLFNLRYGLRGAGRPYPEATFP